jgi:glutamyl-tRNA reductase
MPLFALGLNHRTAPLAIRERLAFAPDRLGAALVDLQGAGLSEEAAIVSTCNRTELYLTAERSEPAVDWWVRYQNLPPESLTPHLYTVSHGAAIEHVFRVASGLDSMVLGEPQILGQMKEAARAAESAGTLGAVLHQLFQRSFAVAKDVRSTTGIGTNIVSMAAAATHLAERVFGDLSAQRVLLVGAGDMIELCATHFAARAPRLMAVANRTRERAGALASRFSAQSYGLTELAQVLPQFDVVVSCTASPVPIIGLGLAERSIRERRHRPMVMIDLAVPRDIEPEVAELDDVFLYTVDDLGLIVEAGRESRQAAALHAQVIIAEQVDHFLQWLERREAVPLIRTLRDEAERLRRHELERATRALAQGTPAAEVLESLSQRLTNKFLHGPTRQIAQAEGPERARLAALFHRLFHSPRDER